MAEREVTPFTSLFVLLGLSQNLIMQPVVVSITAMSGELQQ